MADLKKINEINRVIEAYFTENNTLTIVPVKVLMPDFIRAGIFAKDHKNGLPIRQILRELDKTDQLQLIPFIYPERKAEDTYWYFIPANAPIPKTPYKHEEKKAESKKRASLRLNSDETYVIDLCDKVLEQKANRQKRFDFLLGDLHKDGKTKTKLPVDSYYDSLHLVIQFMEFQADEVFPDRNTPEPIDDPEQAIDNPEREPKKIITRAEQRQIYDQRRIEVLPEHGIDIIEISYSNFVCGPHHKINRNEEADLKVVRTALKKFLSAQ